MRSPADLLADRVRHDGARPLLTQYRGADRTELSAASFANWVDKTTNWLLTEDLSDLSGDDEDVVLAIELAKDEPAHWMTFVWMMAGWQAGIAITPGPWEDPAVRIGGPAITAGGSEFVISCSLHPFAMPGPVNTGVSDFSDEVRVQADLHQAAPDELERVAWLDRYTARTVGDLVADLEPQPAVSLLVGHLDPWETVRAGLLAPLLGGGSAVLASGLGEAELERIRQDEGAAEPVI